MYQRCLYQGEHVSLGNIRQLSVERAIQDYFIKAEALSDKEVKETYSLLKDYSKDMRFSEKEFNSIKRTLLLKGINSD